MVAMMTTLVHRALAALALALVATLAPAQTKAIFIQPIASPLTDTVFDIRVQATPGATVTYSVSTITNATATALTAATASLFRRTSF